MHMQFRYAFRNVNVDLIKRMKEKKKTLYEKLKTLTKDRLYLFHKKSSQRLNDGFVKTKEPNFLIQFKFSCSVSVSA